MQAGVIEMQQEWIQNLEIEATNKKNISWTLSKNYFLFFWKSEFLLSNFCS
jgi:hypothetical protein